MNAVAHSSLSRVFTDLTASTLISSMVRSAFSCESAGLASNIGKTSRAAETNKRRSSVDLFSMSPFVLFWFGRMRNRWRAYAALRALKLFRARSSQEVRGRTLENKLQTDLHSSASARTDYRIRSRHVRGRAGTAESSRARHRRVVMPPAVLSPEWIGKVRVIEEVEKFPTELHVDAFTEMKNLHYGEVHIAEAKIAKGVAAHGAKRAGRGRSHHRLALRVTTKCSELICRGLAAGGGDARSGRGGCARRRSDHVSGCVGHEVCVGDPRDTSGLGRLEVRRTSCEIPTVYTLTRAAKISSGVNHAPRLRTKHADDGIYLPSFQQLPVSFHSGYGVCSGKGEPMPHIVIAAGVLALRVIAVHRQAGTGAE